MMDETYEFSAPMFFDFINGETDEEMKMAENWFDTALAYAPSPLMPKIKEGRSIQIETLCDFSQADCTTEKDEEVGKDCSVANDTKLDSQVENSTTTRIQCTEVAPEETATKEDETKPHEEEEKRISIAKEMNQESGSNDEKQSIVENALIDKDTKKEIEKTNSALQGTDVSTPEPQLIKKKTIGPRTSLKNNQTAKKIASLVRNPTSLKPKPQSHLSEAKCVKPSIARSAMTSKLYGARSAMTAKKTATALNFAQENQAIKRQKLEGGKSREILNIKLQNLPHNKSKLGLNSGATNMCSSILKTRKDDRKLYVREAATPFISAAEMVKRFQSGTRGLELSQRSSCDLHDNGISITHRPKLTLTRPQEPELETSHRVRSIKVKSSSELEEEMMANIPKFKARPLNKKILDALPAPPRSAPQPPEFQEFHLKTMERATQHAETSSVVSTESSHQNPSNHHKLKEPKPPVLETSLRARPTKVKSSQELEEEELENMPKFKAKPLNKKIFESKGDLGVLRIPKGHVTKPQEFHFATDERIPPTKFVTDLFDKLSLNSEPRHDNQIPRITKPNPFHLNTEERGAEKEKKFVEEIMQKQLEEERARIPKATPYPYTTDYPVIPPKPEPKHCTKPEPFQLESLVRHEEEMQREMEERQRMEKEEAQMRLFKAQPILKEDPLPVPEKERKPLTQVEEFVLHVDHRAVDRSVFDKKVKEKEMMYKRHREEVESAKMMEEEKAVKQLRRTLIPHARPVPKFDNPFLPQKSSKETTKAKSPKLRILQRKQRRTSAAACNMR